MHYISLMYYNNYILHLLTSASFSKVCVHSSFCPLMIRVGYHTTPAIPHLFFSWSQSTKFISANDFFPKSAFWSEQWVHQFVPYMTAQFVVIHCARLTYFPVSTGSLLHHKRKIELARIARIAMLCFFIVSKKELKIIQSFYRNHDLLQGKYLLIPRN